MMKFAIYARYSSDLQSDRSIEDQARLCRSKLKGLNGRESLTYADHALSGSFAGNRPQLQKMMSDARAGYFDAIMTEALARTTANAAPAITANQLRRQFSKGPCLTACAAA